MLRFSRTFLAASISAALFAPLTQAAEDTQVNSSLKPAAIDQCIINEPEQENSKEQPINVEADKLEAINGNKATYSGNVVVTQGKKRIKAQSVTLHQKENVVVAEGDVQFNDGQVKTRSDKATNNLNSDEMTLENTDYKFLCQPGRGHAVYVARTGKKVYQIEDGSITSCPEGDSSWRFVASSIDVDQDEEEATFYNPRFEIQNVPVMYLPLLTVPIGDKRKTGFLYPSVSYGSKDGMEMEVPFYWNLAPNYDLETSLHYMQKRGVQLNSKFRYLSELGSGEITSEYLPDDKDYDGDGARWGFQYEHSGIYDKNWKFTIDYSKVSDIDYFTDLSSSVGNREDGQLMQEGEAKYRSDNWDASLLVRNFQLLTESDSDLPYKLLPELSYNYYAPELMRYLDFDVKSHIARFENDSDNKPSATRVHVEPGLTIPLANTWGNWTTEARMLGTYYQQDLTGVDLTDIKADGYDLKESTSRFVPEFRSHAGITLESNDKFLGEYTQTLEPQVQYLYIPKRDQKEIYSYYDTTLLQTDYYGLFRSNPYSSIDYIASANQVSYGATTRFFDDQYKERFNLSFGQIFYFHSASTPQDVDDEESSSDFSAWALESDFNYDDYLFYHGGLQFDTDKNDVQTANSTLEYRFDKGYVQANYRYVSLDYIQEQASFITQDNYKYYTTDGLSQVGLLGAYQLSPKWYATGQYFYDLTTDEPLEWIAGLRYTSDCWYMGFTYSRELDHWESSLYNYPDADPVYENNFGLSFGIIGLGTNMGTDLISSSSSLGYGRPFFLNN
ncbi:LPS assembly protein LptD [Vibrio sp. CAIM 722]|uniref:LPS-assembly protein LptD n=1 Tax=Vibrio eleionomae TaxID=2653505 RepID=A0A7X4LJB0_9VIBR|nr:LPS assembly protein LptD [Vibrio eleionomae]MZI92697.1 LPS assembly protein LptD [Vibrio eleionomae]